MIILENKDKNLIDFWRKENVGNTHGKWCDIDTLLQPWESAKSQYLYKLLGEKLQISKPISYSLPENEIKENLSSSLYNSQFYYNYRKWCSDSNWEVITETQRDFIDLGYLISLSNLYDNTCGNILTKSIVVKKPDGHKFKIFPESKLMRILAKIASAYNIEGFEEFRITHSRIIAEAEQTGTLTLSIHPLDYMTMSNNSNNWTSCMRWDYADPGDYCQGTVEMMNSPCVVEAYIESSSNSLTLDSNFEWNSKRWRELFIVTKDVIAAIKGYPEWDRKFETEVLDWLLELTEKNLGWTYQKEKLTWRPSDTHDVGFVTEYMYNDFCFNHSIYKAKADTCVEINYSGLSECMVCGSTSENRAFDIDCLDLSCGCCDPVYYCANCGDRIPRDEYVFIDGEVYCSYCAEDAYRCDSCREYSFDKVHSISIYDEEIGKYITEELFLCEDCINKYFISLDIENPYVKSNLTQEGEKFLL